MIIGMMRVKNEARWIKRCVESILGVCDRIIVLDDHSTDGTPAICATISRVAVHLSAFNGLDEARDKNFLLDLALEFHPEWIVAIDGDEMLAPAYAEELRAWTRAPHAECLSLRVLYMWDREDQIRTDGVYGDFHRESVFRPNGARFESNSNGGNFHCGNVPWGARQKRRVLGVPLLHFGYMHREDRERKYVWYNERDGGNFREDFYRHMVIGDLFPADSKFLHAGPLKLEPIENLVAMEAAG
jgi:glycosyltransferase involved in cell wall biosynthesis